MIWVQGDRTPGGGVPPGPALALGYPVIGLGPNTLKSRRIDRLYLPVAGVVPLFVTVGAIEGVGTLELG